MRTLWSAGQSASRRSAAEGAGVLVGLCPLQSQDWRRPAGSMGLRDKGAQCPHWKLPSQDGGPLSGVTRPSASAPSALSVTFRRFSH